MKRLGPLLSLLILAFAQRANGLQNNARSANSFGGATFDEKVAACLAAVNAAGGGICDATGLAGHQSIASTITVGDGTHYTTLMLGLGTFTEAPTAQILYNSNASIIGAGTGTTIVDTAKSAPNAAIAPVASITSLGLFNIYIAHLSVVKSAMLSRSVGLMVGASPTSGGLYGTKGGSVLSSVFTDLHIGGFDTGTAFLSNSWGCTCYNHVSDLFSSGTRYGFYAGRFVNSNILGEGGTYNSRHVGLYDAGDVNIYIKPDIESSPMHGIELAGRDAYIVSPYEEADGPDSIDAGASNNTIIGSGYLSFVNNSGNNTNFIWGAHAAPSTIGVKSGIVFGASASYDDGYDSSSTLLNTSGGFARELNGLDLRYTGGQQTVYGHYGHSSLNVGKLAVWSGIDSTGSVNINPIANPAAPTIGAPACTGTCITSYGPYYVVCHGQSGWSARNYSGTTLASPASNRIANGPARLSASNYVEVAWPVIDGCASWDVLKGNTTTEIYSGAIALPIGSTIVRFKDTGQATSAYMTPARNTTGDIVQGTGGTITNGCAGTQVLASGSATVRNSCISGRRPVICTDQTTADALRCAPTGGTLAISGGTTTDVVSWAQM